jgi:hypothetical protein
VPSDDGCTTSELALGPIAQIALQTFSQQHIGFGFECRFQPRHFGLDLRHAFRRHGVSRDREAGEMVRWTISSGERRELGRAAGKALPPQSARASGRIPMFPLQKHVTSCSFAASLASLEEGPAFLSSRRSPRKVRPKRGTCWDSNAWPGEA